MSRVRPVGGVTARPSSSSPAQSGEVSTDLSGNPVLDVQALEFRRTRVAPTLAAPALHRVVWEPIALPATPDARPLTVIGY